MKFAGYIAPNLIFALLIILAWIKIDWGSGIFQAQEDTTVHEEPLVVMHRGKQEYNGHNGYSYVLEYSKLEVFPNNRIKVIKPLITARSAEQSRGEDLGRDESTYKLSGELLSSHDGNQLLITGEPADFLINSPDSQATGSGPIITFDVANSWLMINSSLSYLATIDLLQLDGSQVNGIAQHINFQQQEGYVELSGKVKIEHTLASNKLVLSGQRATIEKNGVSITGGMRMEHQHNQGQATKQTTAQADRGSYKLSGEMHLIGKVQISDGANSVTATEAFYDANTATWRLAGGGDSTEQGSDRVNIIIEQ